MVQYVVGQIGNYPVYPSTRKNTNPETMIKDRNKEFAKFSTFTSSNNIDSVNSRTYIVDLCYGNNGLVRNVLIHSGSYWAEKPLYYDRLSK